jgi:ABC-type polar amino acid transport system ATPase subunit
MLIGRGIRKCFNGREVLHGVDIEVSSGRISVLVGPSGSGKTTLVRALALLDCPTEGRVAFQGHDYSFPLRGRARIRPPWPELTVVFQQHFLWPHLTLRQNIELPLRERPASRHTVDDLIELFRMRDFVDRYPNAASIGERQRAALARAFALEPKCILLDEITSSLDVEQTGSVIRHLLALRQRGVGMLVVTHLLEFARRLLSRDEGDRIFFLDEGRIAAAAGVEFFDSPATERAREFLHSMDYWGASSICDTKHKGGYLP